MFPGREPQADLGGANLWRAFLFGADLSYANLTDASLREAILSGAKLIGATLAEAGLTGAATLTPAQLCRCSELEAVGLPPALLRTLKQKCPEKMAWWTDPEGER